MNRVLIFATALSGMMLVGATAEETYPLAPEPIAVLGRPLMDVAAQFGMEDPSSEIHLEDNPVFPLRWFELTDPLPTRFRTHNDEDRTVVGISVDFSGGGAEKLESINESISIALGPPRKCAADSTDDGRPTWLHNGIRYALQERSNHTSLDISLAWYAHAGSQGLPANALLLDRQCDVERHITLIGMPFQRGSIFMERLYLVIEDTAGSLQTVTELPTGGYEPQLELVDLNGDGSNDAFISVPTGGSGGISAFLAYSLGDDPPQPFLNTEEEEPIEFTGQFEPGYTASVTVEGWDKSFTVELDTENEEYDELGIYRNGELLHPVELWGGGFSAMVPERIDDDDSFALRCQQQIRGVSNADRIALVTALLQYDAGNWIPLEIAVKALPGLSEPDELSAESTPEE